MGFNGILMRFNGILMGFNGILMGFNGIYPLVNVYIANWKMAIEIVDFPTENGYFL